MKERVFETIKQIQREKQQAGLVPDHAQSFEIRARISGLTGGALWACLTRLKEEGRIQTGLTANSEWAREYIPEPAPETEDINEIEDTNENGD